MSSITHPQIDLSEVLDGRARWFKTILSATLVFNLIDAILTLFVVHAGAAVEANPVMAAAFVGGPVTFVMAKFALVSAGISVLWKYRERPLAIVGGVVVFAAYALLMPYHVAGLISYFSS